MHLLAFITAQLVEPQALRKTQMRLAITNNATNFFTLPLLLRSSAGTRLGSMFGALQRGSVLELCDGMLQPFVFGG
jgi:hypothetical protein